MTVDTADLADDRAIDVMRGEIATIPAVLAEQAEATRAPLERIVEDLGNDLGEVVLTGCGDSYFAGLGIRLAMERDAGVRCRPIEALELARYEVRYISSDPRPLLVSLSYSGEVGRTIEATATAAAFGWRTVAVTGRPDGRLAGVSDRSVVMSVPTLGFSPGTSTYVAMCTALVRLTAELARSRGRADAAERADEALARAPELAAATLSATEEPAKVAAALLAESPVVTFLGAGPSRASAAFGAAKLFEGPQRYGVAQDLEEWAHEQYFASDARTPIVVVSPSGASRDRALELIDEMAYIGTPIVFVGDTDDELRARLPKESVVLPTAAGLDEAYSPLLTSLPLALLGFFLSERLGTRSYGFRSDEHEREHYETIHRDTRGEPA